MSSQRSAGNNQSPFVNNKRLNLIPVGRQLQRTPPNKTPRSPSTRPEEAASIKHEDDSQIISPDDALAGQDDPACLPVKEERKSYRRPSITSASAKIGDADPDIFIQGMEGYQWTDVDLEFVYQARQQKRLRQLQQELSEVEKTLQAETQMLELAVASRDQLRSELSKTLSCDSLLQLCQSVLSHSRTSDQLEGLGDKALLSLLELADVQQAVREERTQVRRLEREVQELREKEEIDNYQKKISTLQANIDTLKLELVELRTRLLEKEETSKALQLQREAGKAEVISFTLEETETEERNTSQTPEIKSQVPTKGRKPSRSVRPATKTQKGKVLRETSEKITNLPQKVGKDKVEEGKTAPKEKTSRKTASKKTTKRDTLPERTTTIKTPSQVKTSTEPENGSPKMSNVLKKSRQGSKITKVLSVTPKDKAQKRTTLKDPKDDENVAMVTADKEMTTKGKSAPARKTRKKNMKKDLVPDQTDAVEVPPKVTALNTAEKGHKGAQTAKPSTGALRERTAVRKTGEKETVKIETDEKGKTSRKLKAKANNTAEKKMSPDSQLKDVIVLKADNMEMRFRSSKGKKKTATETGMRAGLTSEVATVTEETPLKVRSRRKTSKQKEVNATTRQETDEDDKHLKKRLKRASKKITTVKNGPKEAKDPEETASENKMAEKTSTAEMTRRKRAARIKAPEETPDGEKALKETRKTALKQKATRQRTGKQPSDAEASTNGAGAWNDAHEAIKSSESQVDLQGTVRRSKRTAAKSTNLSSAIPDKTTRSRQR